MRFEELGSISGIGSSGVFNGFFFFSDNGLGCSMDHDLKEGRV